MIRLFRVLLWMLSYCRLFRLESFHPRDYSGGKKGSFHQMLADANARNNNSGPNVQMPVPGNLVVSMPATNLNMGMDLLNPSAGFGSMKMQPNHSHSGVSQPGVPPPIMADQWGQDERELKR
ncbi:hypothetical protein HanXRQr2_Chr10g0425161 [Helianthus annuus]|uniref:Uncharacterized protein n=1 Tax=Helianthus annuus TaxID=4232 RepID=A0A9K3HV81_HELAN|nr:hypothetical protein HanXRQr2_Chr10g0425161 [Helianthus annuus]KAJ0528861.1 putative G-box-binding factor [Helianthus annuus]KAJ0695777.1 putative G-box-binding factor [Helianthus annuus]